MTACSGFAAGLDFVFHMFFLVKYCKALEEGSFRSRSSDFLWMLIFGASTCVWDNCTRVPGWQC